MALLQTMIHQTQVKVFSLLEARQSLELIYHQIMARDNKLEYFKIVYNVSNAWSHNPKRTFITNALEAVLDSQP